MGNVQTNEIKATKSPTSYLSCNFIALSQMSHVDTFDAIRHKEGTRKKI